jgi:hypothetical protein
MDKEKCGCRTKYGDTKGKYGLHRTKKPLSFLAEGFLYVPHCGEKKTTVCS